MGFSSWPGLNAPLAWGPHMCEVCQDALDSGSGMVMSQKEPSQPLPSRQGDPSLDHEVSRVKAGPAVGRPSPAGRPRQGPISSAGARRISPLPTPAGQGNEVPAPSRALTIMSCTDERQEYTSAAPEATHVLVPQRQIFQPSLRSTSHPAGHLLHAPQSPARPR